MKIRMKMSESDYAFIYSLGDIKDFVADRHPEEEEKIVNIISVLMTIDYIKDFFTLEELNHLLVSGPYTRPMYFCKYFEIALPMQPGWEGTLSIKYPVDVDLGDREYNRFKELLSRVGAVKELHKLVLKAREFVNKGDK